MVFRNWVSLSDCLDRGSQNYFCVCYSATLGFHDPTHTLISVKFYLHRTQSHPKLLCVFKMLSAENRIMHVHPVLDTNSQSSLGVARHSASVTPHVLPAQSASWVTVRHRMNVPDSLSNLADECNSLWDDLCYTHASVLYPFLGVGKVDFKHWDPAIQSSESCKVHTPKPETTRTQAEVIITFIFECEVKKILSHSHDFFKADIHLLKV